MTGWIDATVVAIHQGDAAYPSAPPFSPDCAFPEYPFSCEELSDRNGVYAGVREALKLLRLDIGRYGTSAWNPLGSLISPGDTVLLKPNLISSSRERKSDEWEQIVTHGSVIRAILDYVFIALSGHGKVIIADGPETGSDFEETCRRNGLNGVVDFFADRSPQVPVQLIDLRRERWLIKGTVVHERLACPGDPAGYTTVELGLKSEFLGYALSGHFFGADYDVADTASFHSNGRHAYVLCRSVVDADVVINVPKLKTHRKAGVTLSLKNLVGINGHRNCLPHHTMGTPDQNGDEFPAVARFRKMESWSNARFKDLLVAAGNRAGAWARWLRRLGILVFGASHRVVRSGNWYGNDTLWRMVLDLNKSFFYYDGTGKNRTRPVRYLSIVDGVVAGDGNGPSDADPKLAGVLIAGMNPVAVDTVTSVLMGFDYHKIPTLEEAWRLKECPLVAFAASDLSCVSSVSEWTGTLANLEQSRHLAFRPHFGWLGHIEREPGATNSSEQRFVRDALVH